MYAIAIALNKTENELKENQMGYSLLNFTYVNNLGDTMTDNSGDSFGDSFGSNLMNTSGDVTTTSTISIVDIIQKYLEDTDFVGVSVSHLCCSLRHIN